MEPSKIMNADFLDILFEGKNKAYGAYELRRTYNKRIIAAITGMGAICLVFFLTQIFANTGKGNKPIETVVVQLESIKPKEEVKPETPPVEPPKAQEVKVKVEQFTAFKLVKPDEVTDPPPTQDELNTAQIGLVKSDGQNDEGYAPSPLVEASGTGVVEEIKKPVEDYDAIFRKVEKEAKFPGGMEGWKKFLERTLNANVAADDGAPIGNYTVKVQFIVDKTGSISNVQAIEVPKECPACGPEAVKVIKKGPKWEPAIQNGREVNYQAVQYITFRVSEE